MVQQWNVKGMAMKRIKEWLHNFWWWFRQDPFGYIFEFVLYVLVIALIVFLALTIFLACTGQIQDTGGGHAPHGINLIPMYNGDNVTFLPMPY